MKRLDTTSLKNASGQLKTAIEFAQGDLAKSDHRIFEQFRNSTVQCFEYSFELSIKLLRRKLEMISDNPTVIDELDYKEMIRDAAVKGLIKNPEEWFNFRNLRNISSHAYDQSKAELVFQKANDLYNAVIELLVKLDS